MPDESLVERAEEATGNTGALRRSSRFLPRGEAGLAAWFRRWARPERIAVSPCTYECRLVPSLLQSQEYARDVFEGTIPVVTDEQLGTLLAVRLQRQRMLHERPPFPFGFIVEEHVFRRRFGDTAQMRAMIDHVLEHSARRNVTLQIMPLEGGLYACPDGPRGSWKHQKGSRTGV